MASVNKWIGIGNLGNDPKASYMSNGTAVTNISIACTEKYKDKSGDKKEVTEWINVVFFGKLAEIAAEYLSKGSSVYVEGKFKTDRYMDKETGVEKFSSKIVAETMQMLSSNKSPSAKYSDSKHSVNAAPSFDDDMPF